MRSAARLLAMRGGVMPGRAPVRIVLVAVLVALQSVEIGGDLSLSGSPGIWMLPTIAVGALAASIGFGAAQQRSAAPWRGFLGDRLRASLPVYAIAILGALLLLGPLVTTEPWTDYLTDPYAFGYLLNFVAFPVYTLPRVFEFNNLPDIVNQNVWIAPVALSLAVVTMVDGRRLALRLMPFGLAIFIALAALLRSRLGDGLPDPRTLGGLFVQGQGLGAVIGGLLGIGAFRCGDVLPINLRYAAGSAAVLLTLLTAGRPEWATTAWFPILCALPSAYLALCLSLRGWGWRSVRRAESYLFGVFLFSFPLQQLSTVLLPNARNGIAINLLTGAGVAIAIAIAILVQEGIGRRLMSQRQRAQAATDDGIYVSKIATVRLRRVRSRTILTYAIVGAIFVAGILAVTAMTYFAMLPESSGM